MEEVSTANRLLKSTLDSHESDLVNQIAELDSWERILTERLDKLNKTKYETAHAYGNENAADDDLVEINAGGRVIAAKRSTLTQLKGTRFEGEYLVYDMYEVNIKTIVCMWCDVYRGVFCLLFTFQNILNHTLSILSIIQWTVG